MRSALLALTLLACAACSDESGSKTTEAPAPELPGGDSPGEAYAKVRAVLAQEPARDPYQRIPLLFPHVTVAARVRLLGSLYHEAAFASMTRFEPDPDKLKALNAIYARHGVTTGPLAEDREPAVAIQRRFGAVADKPALMRELLAFLAQHRAREEVPGAKSDEAREVWSVDLSDVVEQGEQASAIAEVRKGAAGRRQPLSFMREAGRWRVDWR